MLPGNFFDDIRIGDERLTPRATVKEGDFLAYAGVPCDSELVAMEKTV